MSAVRKRWGRIAGLWCAVMHGETTWPIHGHYECRQCHKVYETPWQ